jgi:hypothetical protein
MLERTLTLVPGAVLAEAGTFVGEVFRVPCGVRALALQVAFVRAAGGTTCKVYLQTSLDGGITWADIACLAFATTTSTKVSAVKPGLATTPNTTPTDGTMTDNTILEGVLGDRVRVKHVVVGTYSGASSLTATAVLS